MEWLTAVCFAAQQKGCFVLYIYYMYTVQRVKQSMCELPSHSGLFKAITRVKHVMKWLFINDKDSLMNSEYAEVCLDYNIIIQGCSRDYQNPAFLV